LRTETYGTRGGRVRIEQGRLKTDVKRKCLDAEHFATSLRDNPLGYKWSEKEIDLATKKYSEAMARWIGKINKDGLLASRPETIRKDTDDKVIGSVTKPLMASWDKAFKVDEVKPLQNNALIRQFLGLEVDPGKLVQVEIGGKAENLVTAEIGCRTPADTGRSEPDML